MDFERTFPLRLLLNLTRRQDRRERCAAAFSAHGLEVLRQPAIDARRLKSAGRFHSKGQRAHALSCRLMLRRAMQLRVPALFIFEDDVVLHPQLRQRLEALQLPADWGLLYLGCQHHERPLPAGPGLVRATAPLDTHAWGLRAEHFMEARRVLSGRRWPAQDHTPASDLLLAELTRRVPAYAAYPNLAWQREDESDITGTPYGNYHADGTQRHAWGCLRGVLMETLGGNVHRPAASSAAQDRAWFWHPALRLPSEHAAPEPPVEPLQAGQRVAFLFLTRGPHHQPRVWEQYWRGRESQVAVYAHTAERHQLTAGSWLAAAQIPEHIATAWADLSLVRAQLLLLRTALRDPANRFFLFCSESCAPIRPLADFLRLLSLDGRSRFRLQTADEAAAINPFKSGRIDPNHHLPWREWRFHSQWMLLNREAASLIAANSHLLPLFEGMMAPDECVFGTLLHLTGYPVGEKVAADDPTWLRWPDNFAPHPQDHSALPPALAGDLIASGCFFARKFTADCPLAATALHLPPA